MSLTPQEEMAYSMAAFFGKEDAYKERLDKLVAAREEADASAAKVREEREALETATASSTKQLAKEKEGWIAAKAAHDEAAEEARKRIDIARSQQAELDNVKADVEKRHHDVANRESVVDESQKHVDRQVAQLRGAINHVNRLKPALAEVSNIVKSMQDALG